MAMLSDEKSIMSQDKSRPGLIDIEVKSGHFTWSFNFTTHRLCHFDMDKMSMLPKTSSHNFFPEFLCVKAATTESSLPVGRKLAARCSDKRQIALISVWYSGVFAWNLSDVL